MGMEQKQRIIVGISGASGVVMGKYLLFALKERGDVETHLIVTHAAEQTWKCEVGMNIGELVSLADYVYNANDMTARIASGSFITGGMIIIPCSMKTLAGIVSGYTDNLLLRASDVCLKENRRVVLVPRETPLGKIHLRNLATAGDLGCTIVPPMLTFYNAEGGINGTLEAQVRRIVGRVLLRFGLKPDGWQEWGGK
jgi:4-hydroxy-3-polyprenylbenzoate decarboxylase